MFYVTPSFDWYQCTIFVSHLDKSPPRVLGAFLPEDVTFPTDYFEVVEGLALEYGGDVDIRSVPARNGWRYAVQLCRGPRVYCTVSMENGSTFKKCCNLQWTGSDAPRGAEIARKSFPGHSVTRVDVAVDACFSDSVCGLNPGTVLAGCTEIAVRNRLATAMLGDWSGREQSGRTLYIGSAKSAMRIRVYEKGREPDAFPADPAWVRFELVCRPKGSKFRQAAGRLAPHDFAVSHPAFAEIVRAYYPVISEAAVPVSLSETYNRHQADADKTLEHMFAQYGKALRAKCEMFDTNHSFMDWFMAKLYPDDSITVEEQL